MAASIDDILTAIKNNVVAIGNTATNLLSLYKNLPTTLLASGAATTSVSTVYTAQAFSPTHINTINICNTSSSTATVSVYLVPYGGTASAANAVFYNVSVPPNTTVLWEAVLILSANGTIQVSASTTAVTIMIAGGAST